MCNVNSSYRISLALKDHISENVQGIKKYNVKHTKYKKDRERYKTKEDQFNFT